MVARGWDATRQTTDDSKLTFPLGTGNGRRAIGIGSRPSTFDFCSTDCSVYDGFLSDLTTPNTIDSVSSKGFGYGRLGGGFSFLIVLVFLLIAVPDQPPGLSDDGGRIGMGSPACGGWPSRSSTSPGSMGPALPRPSPTST